MHALASCVFIGLSCHVRKGLGLTRNASQVTRLSVSINKPKQVRSRFSEEERSRFSEEEEALFRSDMEARLWPDTMVLLACICAACSAHVQVLTLSTCYPSTESAAKSLQVRPITAVGLRSQLALLLCCSAAWKKSLTPYTTLSGRPGFVRAPSVAVHPRRIFPVIRLQQAPRDCWLASELSSSAPEQTADQVAGRRQVLPPPVSISKPVLLRLQMLC